MKTFIKRILYLRHRDLAEERINAKYYYIIKSALLKYNALNMDMVAGFEPAKHFQTLHLKQLNGVSKRNSFLPRFCADYRFAQIFIVILVDRKKQCKTCQ